MKTIIFTLTRKVQNLQPDNYFNFWGLGDIIRGIIYTYYLCKKFNYEYIVDISQHEISNYITVKKHNYIEYINYNNINFIQKPEEYIKTNYNNIIYFITNEQYIDEIDSECKLFLKDLFTPNDNFKNYMNKRIIDLNLETELNNYSAIHFRLGDDCLVRDIDNITNNINLQTYINLFNKYKTEKYILFSDNNIFKTIIKEQFNAFVLDTKVSHFGYSNNINTIEDTLLEFFILLKVKEIKHYNIYGWVSGFINSASIINDIPLINMV